MKYGLPKINWTMLRNTAIRIAEIWNLQDRYLLQDCTGIRSGLDSSHKDTLHIDSVRNIKVKIRIGTHLLDKKRDNTAIAY